MFATFFIVMFIMLMNVLWRYIDELVGKGLPLKAIIEMLYYTTATMLPLGLPLCTLLAAIMTMGTLGENNEILALKAAGVSLPRIMLPITIVALVVSILSFFVINNYVPYSMRKMGNLLTDIRNQRQEIEFRDGVFFNGIPDISIRVDKQDKKTKELTGVLIYDTRDSRISKTIVAESGYIDISDDNKFMNITLFNGQNYEDNRGYTWYNEPELRHHMFDKQEMHLELDGFSFERSENNMFANASETLSINELQNNIDSLSGESERSVSSFKNDFFKKQLFYSDTTAVFHQDSVKDIKTHKIVLNNIMIDTLPTETKAEIYDNVAKKLASLKFSARAGHSEITDSSIVLYRSKADWHKKLSLPVSVFIFFLIGAPLGAIIRKGGLGMPVVIAVLFFILYYVISLYGEKMVKDGSWQPLLGMWLPAMVLFPIALFLTIKATTDSQLFNFEFYYNYYSKLEKFIYSKLPEKYQKKWDDRRERQEEKRRKKREKKYEQQQ